MPKPAPQHIAAKMPSGWKLWRVEGEIIHTQALRHDETVPGNLWPGRQFKIGELVTDQMTGEEVPGQTYDALISYWMSNYDFADRDRVTLVGHVPANASQIGQPSFLINHDSLVFCPVGLGLPDSWVVCGGDNKVGGLGMIFKAFKAGSANADLHAAVWTHIEQNCRSKRGYIYPLYRELIDWILANEKTGPNERRQQRQAGALDF